MRTKITTKQTATKQFDDVQSAWFWALKSKNAENYMCHPQTICRYVDQLYRDRIMTLDHYRVLYFYGMKQKTPNRHDLRQGRSYHLWFEALDKLEMVMRDNNLLREKKSNIIHFDHYRFNVKGVCHG